MTQTRTGQAVTITAENPGPLRYESLYFVEVAGVQKGALRLEDKRGGRNVWRLYNMDAESLGTFTGRLKDAGRSLAEIA